MENNFMNEAAILNHALKAFDILVGAWKTIGTHPYLPTTTLHGLTSFKWIEGGSFLVMHSKIDEPGFPGGIAIFGSDDSSGAYIMLYFDERNVSRKYDVSFHDNVLKWWRNTSEFSQRYTWTIANDGQTIIGKGEMSKDGSTWEKDLEQTFTRQ